MSDTPTNVLVLVGSLRAASVNRKIAATAAENAPDGVQLQIAEGLADLPFYNEDVDVADALPTAVAELRELAGRAHATLVVTPEYNGTIPAVLKNAIDWLSRPYGNGALKDKPAVVIGAALGRYGGVWAHDETRKSLGIAGARVVESITLSKSVKELGDGHPRDNAEFVAELGAVVGKLVAEVG